MTNLQKILLICLFLSAQVTSAFSADTLAPKSGDNGTYQKMIAEIKARYAARQEQLQKPREGNVSLASLDKRFRSLRYYIERSDYSWEEKDVYQDDLLNLADIILSAQKTGADNIVREGTELYNKTRETIMIAMNFIEPLSRLSKRLSEIDPAKVSASKGAIERIEGQVVIFKDRLKRYQARDEAREKPQSLLEKIDKKISILKEETEDAMNRQKSQTVSDITEEKLLLGSLDTAELPQIEYQLVMQGRDTTVIYEENGMVIFALKTGSRTYDYYAVRKKRTTGEFVFEHVAPIIGDPALHPNLVMFAGVDGREEPISVNRPVRFGNRVITVKARSDGKHEVVIRDIGSTHGTFLVRDINVTQKDSLKRRVDPEDWKTVKAIFEELESALSSRSESERKKAVVRLKAAIDGWTTLKDQSLKQKIFENISIARRWQKASDRQLVNAIEWLRRFFRIYHHMCFILPRGQTLLGEIGSYQSVGWRGFKTITYVRPVFSTMEGGFKANTNEDEVVVLLDTTTVDPVIIGIHEAQHMFDILEYTQYRLKQLPVNIFGQQNPKTGKPFTPNEERLLHLTAFQPWELEFTAYARSMIRIGEKIKNEKMGYLEECEFIDSVFGGQLLNSRDRSYLELYLRRGESEDEHVIASLRFLTRFLIETLRGIKYGERIFYGSDERFDNIEQKDVERIAMEIEGTDTDTREKISNLREFIDNRQNIMKFAGGGDIIKESTEQVLQDFYMRKLGYVPNYPDTAALTQIGVVKLLLPDTSRPGEYGEIPLIAMNAPFDELPTLQHIMAIIEPVPVLGGAVKPPANLSAATVTTVKSEAAVQISSTAETAKLPVKVVAAYQEPVGIKRAKDKMGEIRDEARILIRRLGETGGRGISGKDLKALIGEGKIAMTELGDFFEIGGIDRLESQLILELRREIDNLQKASRFSGAKPSPADRLKIVRKSQVISLLSVKDPLIIALDNMCPFLNRDINAVAEFIVSQDIGDEAKNLLFMIVQPEEGMTVTDWQRSHEAVGASL